MKIKKKEYKKRLKDEYWRGIELGMRFALDNPDTAEKYRDNIPKMRYEVERASEVMEKVANAITNLFKR